MEIRSSWHVVGLMVALIAGACAGEIEPSELEPAPIEDETPVEPQDPATGPEAMAPGSCACDVTELCDEGCACDLACTVEVREAPLGDDARLFGRAEIVALTASSPGAPTDELSLYDDGFFPEPGATYAESVRIPELPYAPIARALPHGPSAITPASVTADIDGDGDDEVATFDPSGLTIVDLDAAGDAAPWLAFDLDRSPVAVALARADFDADGADELVAVDNSFGTVTAVIYDAVNGAMVASRVVGGGAAGHDVGVAAADLDRDGRQEIYVASIRPAAGEASSLRIDRLDLHDAGLLPTESRAMPECTELADGDADGIALAAGSFSGNEPVLAIASSCGPLAETAVRVLSALDQPGDRWPGRFGTSSSSFAPAGFVRAAPQLRPSLAFVHPRPHTGEPVELVVAYTGISDRNPQAQLTALRPDPIGPTYGLQARSAPTRLSLRHSTGMVLPVVSAADVDLDGGEELVVGATAISTGPWCPAYTEGCPPARVRGAALFVSRYPLPDNHIVSPFVEPEGVVAESESFGPMVSVALADLDADGLRVRATGQVLRHTGQPHVNALVAAPPTWDGVDGITQDGSTSFGVADTTGASSAHQISASAAVTLSYSTGFKGVVDVGASVTASLEASWGTSIDSSVTQGMEITGGVEDDLVYFTVTPYASYVYEVLAHPDAALVGTTMTIDIPGASYPTTQSLQTFRRTYGELADALIPPELVDHTIGDPMSYKRPGDCTDTALAQALDGIGQAGNVFRSDGLIDVGNSDGGSTTRSVSYEQQIAESEEFGFGVELEFGVSGAGVGVDVTAGVSSATTHETYVGSEVSYTGEVGNLGDGEYDADHRYLWGQCVYNFRSAGGQSAFPVIDYVVSRDGN